MKYCFFMLLILPAIAFGQTKKDYENVMKKFIKFYNNDEVDSICTLFPNDNCFWREADPKGSKDKYGKILSCKYLGKSAEDPESVTIFKIVFEKMKTKAMSFTLDHENKFGTFRFDTSSDEIKKMLKKAH